MTTLVLVSCVKSKRDSPAPARDLYTSALFRGMRAYAEKYGDRWFILSAEHGLLHPDQVVAPYERTLNRMQVAARRVWASTVLDALRPVRADRVLLLAGQRYREFLEAPLRQRYPRVEVPMEGLRMGEQLAWLAAR